VRQKVYPHPLSCGTAALGCSDSLCVPSCPLWLELLFSRSRRCRAMSAISAIPGGTPPVRSQSSQFGVDFSIFYLFFIRDHPRSSAIRVCWPSLRFSPTIEFSIFKDRRSTPGSYLHYAADPRQMQLNFSLFCAPMSVRITCCHSIPISANQRD
jgi:hypothetical protein